MVSLMPLIGVVIIVIGLALGLNTLLVILTAGVVTGLVADMAGLEIMSAIGEAFTKNRAMSTFILVLPVIGLLERNGLRERAELLIRSIKRASSGRVNLIYMFFRGITNAFGMSLGGHPTMVRPLIAPMAEGAASEHGTLSYKLQQKIRAVSASVENFGNFFSQLCFVAAGGILLIHSTLQQKGYDVSLESLIVWAIPTLIASFIVMAIRLNLLDRGIAREHKHIGADSESVLGGSAEIAREHKHIGGEK